MPSDEQLTLLIVRLELFTVEQTTFTKNELNLSIHHKSRHQLHKVHVSCLECLCLQPGNAGTNTNFRCFKYPKKSLLKSSRPKKYLPNFLTQKIPGIKNFKPKNILRSSLSLEIQRSPHLRLPLLWGGDLVDIHLLPKMKLLAALLSEDTY